MTGTVTEQTLDRIENLVKHLLAIQLYRSGVNQRTIAKHLGIAKAKANDILKGVNKVEKINEETKSQNH